MLRTYEEFLNESKDVIDVNEAANNFVYSQDASIKNESDLIKKIEGGISNAFSQFLKEKFGIPVKAMVSKGRRNDINISTVEIPRKALGIFEFALSSCTIGRFNGGELHFETVDGEFSFHPYIWFTINISYDIMDGGSNGVPLIMPGEKNNQVWYDVIESKFMTTSEAQKIKDKIWKK